MAIATVVCYDAISANFSRLPKGAQHAGYTTGSGGIGWTAAQWNADPYSVRIDQDFQARDTSADVLDVESHAATPAECPGWVKAARASYNSARRPGQRNPAIYCNQSTLPAVCNSLIAGGVTGNVNIWLANWSLNAVQAADKVVSSSGPFPIIGVQFTDAGLYDISVFSVPWLYTVSGGSGNDPDIREGASGPPVTKAQHRLNIWGAHLVVDGDFGPLTTTAVVSFQRGHSLSGDGVCGSLTWAKLNAAP